MLYTSHNLRKSNKSWYTSLWTTNLCTIAKSLNQSTLKGRLLTQTPPPMII